MQEHRVYTTSFQDFDSASEFKDRNCTGWIPLDGKQWIVRTVISVGNLKGPTTVQIELSEAHANSALPELDADDLLLGAKLINTVT